MQSLGPRSRRPLSPRHRQNMQDPAATDKQYQEGQSRHAHRPTPASVFFSLGFQVNTPSPHPTSPFRIHRHNHARKQGRSCAYNERQHTITLCASLFICQSLTGLIYLIYIVGHLLFLLSVRYLFHNPSDNCMQFCYSPMQQ